MPPRFSNAGSGGIVPAITGKSQEQKNAEAEVAKFRQELGPFVVAAEATRMAMIFTDAKLPDSPLIFANDSFLSLTGYPRKEVLGQKFRFLLAQGTDPAVLAQIAKQYEGRAESSADIVCRRKDGSVFWAALSVSPVRDAQGAVVQHFASFVDLSRQRDAQVRADFLIDELNHRVKNNISAVQSIVRQAFRTTTGPEAIRESIESRLFALSRSHDLLIRQNWDSAGLADVLQSALEPFAQGRENRIAIAGEDIRLPPKAAVAMGMALGELATNAVKYGAFSNERGSILVEWKIGQTPAGERLNLRWQERDGPRVAVPSHRGFGSRVIECGLAHELHGKVVLDYRPEGLVCSMDLAAPRAHPDG
jgi:PAS domain S-box-containing protein